MQKCKFVRPHSMRVHLFRRAKNAWGKLTLECAASDDFRYSKCHLILRLVRREPQITLTDFLAYIEKYLRYKLLIASCHCMVRKTGNFSGIAPPQKTEKSNKNVELFLFRSLPGMDPAVLIRYKCSLLPKIGRSLPSLPSRLTDSSEPRNRHRNL